MNETTTPKFNTHDIVTDGTYEYRIYNKISYLSNSYDCVAISGSYGHVVKNESELTMVRKYEN